MYPLYVIISSAVSFIYLFFLVKLTGNRQISELGTFDYISSISIGSIAAEFATEPEEWYVPAIAMAVFGGLTALMPILTDRFSSLRSFLDGKTLILFRRGKFYMKNFKSAKLDMNEFMASLREKGYFSLQEIDTVIWEWNGKLSILPVSNARPATPKDLNLSPAPAETELIVTSDGRIFDKNLSFQGKDQSWLEKKAAEQGSSLNDKPTASCSGETLTVYKTEDEKKQLS